MEIVIREIIRYPHGCRERTNRGLAKKKSAKKSKKEKKRKREEKKKDGMPKLTSIMKRLRIRSV